MGDQYLNLANGERMPIFGLGTAEAKDEEQLKQALETAVDSGYKLIDTAHMYGNEKVIGQFLKEKLDSGKLKRNDIYVVTKLSGIFMGGREAVRQGFMKSYNALQLDYIDLFLIHSPVGLELRDNETLFPISDGKLAFANHDLVETWKALEELVDEGKIKSLGVSNFNSVQMDKIQAAAKHPICNNQVEIHAYLQQGDLVNFCNKKNITLTAYAPIGSPTGGDKNRPSSMPMEDPLIKQLAEKYSKTPAQILLCNLMQRNLAVVPKSVTPSRIRQNIEVFDFSLTEEEMEAIKGLDKNERVFAFKHSVSHPEYPFHIAY